MASGWLVKYNECSRAVCEQPAARDECPLSEEVTVSLGHVIIIVGAVLVGLVVLAPIIGLTIGLALTLLVAGLIGWLADRVVPGGLRRHRVAPPQVAPGLQGAYTAALDQRDEDTFKWQQEKQLPMLLYCSYHFCLGWFCVNSSCDCSIPNINTLPNRTTIITL